MKPTDTKERDWGGGIGRRGLKIQCVIPPEGRGGGFWWPVPLPMKGEGSTPRALPEGGDAIWMAP